MTSRPATTAATTDPVVSIRGLRKRYGNREALRAVALEIRRGATFAFLGPNSAGRTATSRSSTASARPATSASTCSARAPDCPREPPPRIGIKLDDIKVTRPTLEDIYRQLTPQTDAPERSRP